MGDGGRADGDSGGGVGRESKEPANATHGESSFSTGCPRFVRRTLSETLKTVEEGGGADVGPQMSRGKGEEGSRGWGCCWAVL